MRDSFKFNIESILQLTALGSQGLKKKLGSSAKRKKKHFIEATPQERSSIQITKYNGPTIIERPLLRSLIIHLD